MIFSGSRYAQVAVNQVVDSRGQLHSALGIRLIPATPAGYLYTVRAGDRLDNISSQFYGNPEKFWLIGDANSAMDVDDLLTPGLQILIPPDRTV
jgi:nucleoid-associated protein YgaU